MNSKETAQRNLMLCRHLRTKKMYLSFDEEPDYSASTTAVFWCMRTLSVVGPDDAQACAEDCCRPGRACYENDRVPAPGKPPMA